MEKGVEDTVGLNTFFNNNQSSYMWDDRINATIYTCLDLATAKEVKKEIFTRNKEIKITDEEILTKINSNKTLGLKLILKILLEVKINILII